METQGEQERLPANILPGKIIEDLKESGKTDPGHALETVMGEREVPSASVGPAIFQLSDHPGGA